ncbi:hypothetical protein ABZX85_49270 [Streptomyces sp. NPDC004539]|uniref:hypothetical protein n=1 Tax=Streptomyces sp. NPDC004539 TaxID=3154280 RepID=UPI0033B62D85
MRPPAELDTVQWHTLTHAYGTAEDVPGLIRALYEGAEPAEEAIYELYGNIHHQGSVYEASAPAVPFLAHAARHAPGRAADLLMLLAVLADHDPEDTESRHWAGSDTAAICAELRRVLPDLLPCLDDPDTSVRRAALRTVAVVAGLLPADLRARAEQWLDALYAGDPDPAVRADALTALARFGRAPQGLDDPAPEVRLAAAVLHAERCGAPYPAGLVEVFAAVPPGAGDGFPWSDGVGQHQRITALLGKDPDAALTIAARWIDAGDAGTHGSWLAEEIAETWRDREPEVLTLLLAALPHHADDPAARIRAIAHWTERLPKPPAHPAGTHPAGTRPAGTGFEAPATDRAATSHARLLTTLRDTLHPHATTDGDAAAPALLALLRAEDPRALDLLADRLTPALLEAAAHHFPEHADRLVPLIRRELAAGATGNAAITLVGALTPFGAAARTAHPELVDCLRTGRAAIVAARRLGHLGVRTPETTALLRAAMDSPDASLSISAAVAHHQLTDDPVPTLDTIRSRLLADGRTHWYLRGLRPLGSAAAPLLPVVEPLLDSRDDWTRLAAAEVHHWITGSPDRALPVLTALVGPTPVGLDALRTLTVLGHCPAPLRPTLRALSFSPHRLLTDLPHTRPGHTDDELRTLARMLLTDART